MKVTDNQWEDGLAVVDRVYGREVCDQMRPHRDSSFTQEIVVNQFGKVWDDPTLSMREKRLMALGATAMLGRADLVETQIFGALINNEFTDEQLAEIPRFMLFYAGAGNTTAVARGIRAAQAKYAAQAAS